MSDQPIVRQRTRPDSANQVKVVDQGQTKKSQTLVEQAIEASLCEPRRRRRGEAEASKAAEGDYAVGYKRPPVHSRFRKGHCPNPNGRPKKAKLSVEDQLAAMLEEQVTVTKDGKPQRMTTREVGLQRLVQAYMKGDLKAISLVTQWENKRALLRTTSDVGGGEPALEEPSAETLRLIADIKAGSLRNAGLSTEQVSEVLTIFGLPLVDVSSHGIECDASLASEDGAAHISASPGKACASVACGPAPNPNSNLGADR